MFACHPSKPASHSSAFHSQHRISRGKQQLACSLADTPRQRLAMRLVVVSHAQADLCFGYLPAVALHAARHQVARRVGKAEVETLRCDALNLPQVQHSIILECTADDGELLQALPVQVAAG